MESGTRLRARDVEEERPRSGGLAWPSSASVAPTAGAILSQNRARLPRLHPFPISPLISLSFSLVGGSCLYLEAKVRGRHQLRSGLLSPSAVPLSSFRRSPGWESPRLH